jgi:hypothetical protein
VQGRRAQTLQTLLRKRRKRKRALQVLGTHALQEKAGLPHVELTKPKRRKIILWYKRDGGRDHTFRPVFLCPHLIRYPEAA